MSSSGSAPCSIFCVPSVLRFTASRNRILPCSRLASCTVDVMRAVVLIVTRTGALRGNHGTSLKIPASSSPCGAVVVVPVLARSGGGAVCPRSQAIPGPHMDTHRPATAPKANTANVCATPPRRGPIRAAHEFNQAYPRLSRSSTTPAMAKHKMRQRKSRGRYGATRLKHRSAVSTRCRTTALRKNRWLCCVHSNQLMGKWHSRLRQASAAKQATTTYREGFLR